MSVPGLEEAVVRGACHVRLDAWRGVGGASGTLFAIPYVEPVVDVSMFLTLSLPG